MPVIIKNVSQKSDLRFDRDKDARWWSKNDQGKFVRVPNEREVEKEFCLTNVVICYNGNDFRLRSWTDKKIGDFLDLFKLNLPDIPVEEIRQDLWDKLKSGKLPGHLKGLSQSIKEGKTITIWYVSSHDMEKVKLIERFLNWHSQQ